MNNDTVYIEEFSKPGTYKVNIPERGIYRIECWGAQGGKAAYVSGGKGGYISAEFILDNNYELYAVVGGVNGYNGGGENSGKIHGGGASDVRIGNNILESRVIVAGGGGGVTESNGSKWRARGGNGGYPKGEDGGKTERYGGVGGGQYVGANYRSSFGKGGDGQISTIHMTSGVYLVNHGPGGGGWFGGGGVNSQSSYAIGGGGGSGYVLTHDSYKPEGYMLDKSHYGRKIQFENGCNQGDGKVIITLVKKFYNFYHYVFTIDNKNFYIPTMEFYNKELKKFETVDKSFIMNVAKNKDKLVSNKEKLFETINGANISFYKYMKDENIKIVKVLAYIDGYENEEDLSEYCSERIHIKHKINEHGLDNSKVNIYDYIDCKKQIGNYYVETDAGNTKFLLESEKVFFNDKLEPCKVGDIKTSGFTDETILNKRIGFEQFKLLFRFNSNILDKFQMLKNIKVKFNNSNISKMLKESEYDIIKDSETNRTFIKFNNSYSGVTLNKTYVKQESRINTLDEF